MLELKDITKIYKIGSVKDNTYQEVRALNGVSIKFRKSEFVSVLGPSGCGKTTMLNIIGGLDRYTSGDLEIDGISTKEYKDRNWDNYRNNRIGFVFQSYNLIPHLSVLENVELALTLSGVKRAERREKARQALIKVGLGDRVTVKPNQLSGGQMQRVAIARALVNDPEIILADEPTGALDSGTSKQVMEILKEVSKERLVIMVTHNKDLADTYSTRIINMLDGKLVGDSRPLTKKEEDAEAKKLAEEQKMQEQETADKKKKEKKPKKRMSYFTALALSFKNLLTKKARTALVSFAGSIGIIGIALVLSVSSGFQAYVNLVQQDTLSKYPITVNASSSDYTSIVESVLGSGDDVEFEEDKVYDSEMISDIFRVLNGATTNNLTRFKEYLETPEINEKIKDIATIKYTYNLDLNIFYDDAVGVADDKSLLVNPYQLLKLDNLNETAMNLLGDTFDEMLDNEDLIKSQYSLIAGDWAKENVYTDGEDNIAEVIVVLDKNNSIPDYVLMALGLRNRADLVPILTGGEVSSNFEMNVEDFIGMEYSVVLNPNMYEYNTKTGLYDKITSNVSASTYYAKDVAPTATIEEKACVKMRVVGVVKPNPDASASSISGTIAYTHGLTDFVVEKLDAYTQDDTIVHNIIKDQQKDQNKNKSVISGKFFELSEEEIYKYYTQDKPSEYEKLTYEEQNVVDAYGSLRVSILQKALDVVEAFGEGNLPVDQALERAVVLVMDNIGNIDNLTEDQQDAVNSFANIYSDYLEVSEDLMGTFGLKLLDGSTYEETLDLIGQCRLDSPKSISFYAIDFESKQVIESVIADYNKAVLADESLGTEDERIAYVISYTDYVGLIMSSVSKIIIYITYILIAVVAISLVVSSIMIGVITYISVLERTKEIGVLRSVGASKRDIKHVFTAESLIVGIIAGLLGIGITLLLQIPINVLFASFTEMTVVANLPVAAAFILIGISMVLTYIAGLIPANIASKKDPVVALRSE